MSIEELTRVLEPPHVPRDTHGSAGWEDVERRLGGRVPTDYRAFIERYGTGYIGKFLTICNPFCEIEGLNLFGHGNLALDALRELREHGERIPYPIFPEPGGLFPFGSTDNGDTLYWLTSGAPDSWRVAVNEARGPLWEVFEMTTTTFLARLFSRDLRCNVFPDDFPSPDAKFEVLAEPNGGTPHRR